VESEGLVFAPAKPAFPPSLAVKPQAKHWPDEQDSYMRRSQWVRRHISSKPDTCTKTAGIYAAGISVKVTRITLGDLSTCHRLLMLRGIGKGAQKSAEAIVETMKD